MLITFEGLDLSGKSTQAQRLHDRLRSRGRPVVLLRDPGGTRIGEKIRTVLLDRMHEEMDQRAELFLFSASRAQLVHERIRPALEQGQVVLLDRFYDSTTAYQGGGRGLPLEELQVINRCAASGLVPDLTFFLDTPLSVIEQRRRDARSAKDRMEANDRQFYARVRQAYLDLASREPRFSVLDGTQSIEVLENRIWEIVLSRL
jgi:dTMP kinase